MLPQKPLEKAEKDLLTVIVRLHAARGPMHRDMLSVEARGQGLEFGRALSVLRGMGLVEEVAKKPFFLARLLGAKPIALIQPTQSGLALMAEVPAEPPADMAPVLPPEHAADVAAEIVKDTAPVPVDPVAEAAVEPAPVAPTPQTAPATPRPLTRSAAPRRPVPLNVYTEDLGGIPDEDVPLVAAFRVDPDIMDGLRETLDVIGMPLTFAGEALVADRIAQGATPGDALMQVVVYTFAHAIRLDSLTKGTIDMAGLAQYGTEVLREMDRLRDAGAVTDARFAQDSARISDLVGDGAARLALADDLLTDPVGGAAPPALLPEDLRLPTEDIGEPTY